MALGAKGRTLVVKCGSTIICLPRGGFWPFGLHLFHTCSSRPGSLLARYRQHSCTGLAGKHRGTRRTSGFHKTPVKRRDGVSAHQKRRGRAQFPFTLYPTYLAVSARISPSFSPACDREGSEQRRPASVDCAEACRACTYVDGCRDRLPVTAPKRYKSW